MAGCIYKASLSSVIDLGLDGACYRLRTSHLSHGSPWCLGQTNLETSNISDQFQAADLKPYMCYMCMTLIDCP